MTQYYWKMIENLCKQYILQLNTCTVSDDSPYPSLLKTAQKPWKLLPFQSAYCNDGLSLAFSKFSSKCSLQDKQAIELQELADRQITND